MIAPPPMGPFGCILADPPWRFESFDGKSEVPTTGADPYPTMSLAEIKALPLDFTGGPDCALVMWATAPLLPAALEVMTAWGFAYKTAGAWAKQSSTGRKWAFGTGYTFRSAAEFFLVGMRGSPPVRSKSVRNLIVAPVRQHSRKPDDLHAMCESLFDGPYLELFSREARPGWTGWGLETDRFGPEGDRGAPPSTTPVLSPDRVARRERIATAENQGLFDV